MYIFMSGKHAIIEHYGSLAQMNGNQLVKLMEAVANEGGATILNSHMHGFDGGGYTGFVMLAESHISVHTWPESNYAAFDIFMCGDKVSLDKAIQMIINADKNGVNDVKVIARGLPPTQIQCSAYDNANEC